MSASDYTVSRKGWPAGPWDGEPDRVEWRDEVTGLPCLIVRGPVGALCGYVGVPPGHPWHSIGSSACVQKPPCGEDYCCHGPDVDVHGGLTYAAACVGHICHTPAPGEPDNVWWFGFDCAHFMDVVPGILAVTSLEIRGQRYRDVAYVRDEVTRLAAQLKAVA